MRLRWLWILPVLGVLSGCTSPMQTLYAQSLPITKAFLWDAVPDPCVAPNAPCPVLDYAVSVDGIPVATVTGTTTPITLTSVGAHTLSVTARNVWGLGSTATLPINVVVPGKPANLRTQ